MRSGRREGGIEESIDLNPMTPGKESVLTTQLHPRPLEQIGVGLIVSVLASLINVVVAQVLLRAGKKSQTITLEADARHLLTDVWTSVGVVVGVGAVALTGWVSLDPIVALLVAANIFWTGGGIVKRSVQGLMDRIEAETKLVVENATVFTHLECQDDPTSWDEDLLS